MKIFVLVIQNTEFNYSVVVGSAFYSAVFFWVVMIPYYTTF